MKKSLTILIVLVVLGGLVWFLGKGKKVENVDTNTNNTPTASAPLTETTKVSDKVTEYKNEELGFSVKYPTVWEAGSYDYGINFTIPYSDKTSTIKKLESKVSYTSGKCVFPPVTTVKDRSTLKSGDLSFNMISMSNSVQGINYFDRMYSHQKDANTCYTFSFSSIYINPSVKGYKGSEATQMLNNSKTVIDEADKAFTDMVKSFAYVIGPAGQDETTVAPAKK